MHICSISLLGRSSSIMFGNHAVGKYYLFRAMSATNQLFFLYSYLDMMPKTWWYPTFKGQRPTLGFDRGHNLLFYTHLLTGYIGSVSLNTVVRVVDKLRVSLFSVCDPVLGDEGKLYVPEELLYLYIEKRLTLMAKLAIPPSE
ncbi:hypothetical protein SASPL_143872 [Salvia splendens]|uniref:pyridoxal kinase n=1 Tax=Salvia splendens TaxID=180675 RepID=A0A8X8WMM4_SALSN|nr:hypothetical protein SASPL_143872 [Salvia splendens]